VTHFYEKFEDPGIAETLRNADEPLSVNAARLTSHLAKKRRQRRKARRARKVLILASVLLAIAFTFKVVPSTTSPNPVEVRSTADANSSVEALGNLGEHTTNRPSALANRENAAEQALIARTRRAKLAKLESEIEMLKKRQSRQQWLLLREVASRNLQRNHMSDSVDLN
jgi:hypothetical protein